MGANVRRVLDETELKIGRDAENDWVLPQSYVSRRQAIVRCVNGMHFLEQIGSCPITLNDGGRPLERNRIARLSSGDRMMIDDIEIRVLESDALPAAEPRGPSPTNFPELGLPAEPIVPIIDPLAAGGAVDPLELLGISAPHGRHPPAPSPRMPGFGSVLDEAMVRPTPAAPAPLADDWFSSAPTPRPAAVIAPPRRPAPPPPAAPVRAAPPPPVAPVRPAAPPPRPVAPSPPGGSGPDAGGGASLGELLRGAGIDPRETTLSPEVAYQLGEVLRIVVDGTMQVLEARNDIRKEFRLPMTQVARRDNNPLKFSADVADALHKLLVQRSPAYLDTVSSFEDAFDDIRVHQLVMLASLRAAFDHMLKEFDPAVLQERFARHSARGSVLGIGAKPKPWELYTARYAELTADSDSAFRRLFGEEFGKAYEQNLERQRRMIKASKRGPV